MQRHLDMDLATSDQYSPKAVLLTGGAGFIGSHVAIRIVEKHAHIKVVVYDSLEYRASIRNLDAIRTAPNFTFVKGDVRSADLVRHVLDSHAIDTIMHFAAQTHADNSFGNSIDFTASLLSQTI
jgi:UDP-glucose 4,6-dehydratase